MMEHHEDQAEELEALEAIFDTDFRLLQPPCDSCGARFEIDLVDDLSETVKLRIIFTHTSQYPAEPLSLVVHALEGLSTPRRKDLQIYLESVAKDCIEVPCAYTICEKAKEWIEENVVGNIVEDDEDEPSTKFETLDSTQDEKVEVISNKAVGTPVTVKSFAAWREEFLNELDTGKSKEQAEKEKNTKVTGRVFFESRTIVVSVESESFWECEAMAAEAE